MRLRYVKVGNNEPGVRRDLLTGQDIYSSRFLNAEEHGTTGHVERLWVGIWCMVVGIHTYTRKEYTVRWNRLNILETALVVLGLLMWVLILWASTSFWMP